MLESSSSRPYLWIGHYRSGSTGVYNRVVNEGRAAKQEVDIIELSAGPVADLIRGGFVDPYRSPETDAMRPEFIDPRNLWSAYHYLVVGLAYNKNLVKTSEVPKTYQDLLLPRWRGRKMSLEKDAGDVFGGLLDSWGEKQGIEYFRRLAKQDVLIRSGYTLQAQLPAAGEVELVPWSHSQRPLLMADSGAPLGIRIFGTGTLQSPSAVAGASRASSARRGAFHRLGPLGGGSGICRHRHRAQPCANWPKAEICRAGATENQSHHTGISRPNYERYTKLYHEIFNTQ